MGMEVYIARLKGYEPNEGILKFTQAKAKETGTKLVEADNAVLNLVVV